MQREAAAAAAAAAWWRPPLSHCGGRSNCARLHSPHISSCPPHCPVAHPPHLSRPYCSRRAALPRSAVYATLRSSSSLLLFSHYLCTAVSDTLMAVLGHSADVHRLRHGTACPTASTVVTPNQSTSFKFGLSALPLLCSLVSLPCPPQRLPHRRLLLSADCAPAADSRPSR